MEGSSEHDSEPSGSIKCWEVHERLHNWQLLKKDSAPWVNKWLPHNISWPYFKWGECHFRPACPHDVFAVISQLFLTAFGNSTLKHVLVRLMLQARQGAAGYRVQVGARALPRRNETPARVLRETSWARWVRHGLCMNVLSSRLYVSM
jgi:hypothetical protein